MSPIPTSSKGLQAVLESTDLDTIKTYLRWQLINSIPEYALPKAMRRGRFQLSTTTSWTGSRCSSRAGSGARRPRTARMGEAVGQVYVAKNFPAASKAFTLQMVHDIEAAMGTETAIRRRG